jgi:type IV pilus assembly protein PilW
MSRVSSSQHPARGRQYGLSLVELLVALTVGLFLIAGVLTLMAGLKKTYTTQMQLTQLQDSERLAMTMLTDVIQSAGYYTNPQINTSSVLPANPPFAVAGQALTGTSQPAGPDTISVQFATAPGDGIINCQGGSNVASPAPFVYVNTFSVNPGPQNQLQCQLNGGAQVPLVNNLQNMMIWYGVNTSGGPSCSDSYLRASEVTAGNNWTNVCSVMVQLTFTNPLNAAAPVQFTRVIVLQNLAD